jgi:hypothetical protein
MKNSEQILKYEVSPDDWKNMNIVDMKIKAETITALFIAIENTLAPHISPEESELINATKDKLLSYLDKYFINIPLS